MKPGRPLVILTRFPDRNGIPYQRFKIVMKALISALYPDRIDDIEFQIGSENGRGVNAIEVRASLSKSATPHLEYKLKQFLGQEFTIKGSSNVDRNWETEINRAAELLHVQLDT